MKNRVLSTLGLLLLAGLSFGAEMEPAMSPAVQRWHALHASLPLHFEVIKSPPQGGAGGVTVGGTNLFSGTNRFLDTGFTVCDDADPTKCVNYGQLSGITTANTLTPFVYTGTAANPNITVSSAANFTVTGTVTMGTGASGIGITVGKYLCFNTVNYPCINDSSVDTPDILKISVETVSRGLAIVEQGDESSDMAHPQATHPWAYIHTSNTSPTTQYTGYGATGLRGELFKTLTESAATSIVRIPVAAGGAVGGTIEYGIFAADATDQQLRQSTIRVAVTNKAATETCTITTMAGAAVTNETNDGNAAAISAGTLTYGVTCDTTPANAVDIQINAVSSLTQTTLQARYRVNLIGPGEPLPQ